MSAEDLVSLDAAEAEFAKWIEAMDLSDKVDPSALDDEDKKALAAARAVILRSIQTGRLVVDDKGQFVFSPVTIPDKITFYEPSGSSLVAADSKKEGHNAAKMFAVMAEFTRTPAANLMKMKNRDLKVCNAVSALFLG